MTLGLFAPSLASPAYILPPFQRESASGAPVFPALPPRAVVIVAEIEVAAP